MSKDISNKEFGQKLRKYRLKAGISQTELAIACGFPSKASISKIENGHQDMKRDKLQLAAEKLGISPLAFFYDDPEDITIPESNLLSTFRQLSERGKEDVLNYADYQLQRERGLGKKESKDKHNTGLAE
jgi:transcriptional regulator with XRE-family HTH domain